MEIRDLGTFGTRNWARRLSGIPNWGHSDLGAQSGCKNQPACFHYCHELQLQWIKLVKNGKQVVMSCKLLVVLAFCQCGNKFVSKKLTVLFLLLCFQSTGAEIPLDLSKSCNKRLESPLDLSQKNVVTNGREDVKPLLFGPTLQYPTPSSLSCLPATQAKRNKHIQSTSVSPVLSVFAANMLLSPLSTTLVQKVRPQTYTCAASKEIDSSTKTCVVATAHMLSQVPSSSKCYTSHCSDRVRSVHSGSRNISIVKPAAASVSDVHLAVSASHTVANNCSSQTLLPSQPVLTSQKIGPRYSAALFDTSRADRGLPLAQVYPSRVVTSTAQNTTTETVPSPVHCIEELQRKSLLNNTPQPDRNCALVCVASSLSTATTSSHVESFASPPVLTSPSKCNTVKFPVSVPAASTTVSPSMPILSPNVPSSSSTDVLPRHTLTPELCPMKSTSGKDVLPPTESSPMSLSDRDSIPDEDDSGHELSSSLMEWDDNVSDRKDFGPDTCHTEELSVKRPAFEVIGDCNRTFLSDISQPCYAAVAFDQGLLHSKCTRRNFITRTKYYRFFSRKTATEGSGPHDLDVVQPEKCDSSSMSNSTSQEQCLSASSALKLSYTLSASAAVRQKEAFSSGGKDGNVTDADDIPSKHSSLPKESKCKYRLLHKKTNKLQYQQLPHNGSIDYNVIGSIYSPVSNNRLKGGSRAVHSSSLVQVKSELDEDPACPDVLSRSVCRRRRKVVPTAFDSSNEVTGTTYEENSTVSDQERDFCASAKSLDVKNNVESACVKHVVCDSGDACSKIVFKAHSDTTKVNESSNKVHCKKELLTESAVVNGNVNSGRKNPHDKLSDVSQKKRGDANNNQGKIRSLAASTSVTSVSESEHLKVKTSTAEANSVSYSQPSAKVTVHTRSSTVLCKSDSTASYSHHQMTSNVPRTRQMCSDMKSKESRHSANDAALLLSSKCDRTVVKQACVTSNTHQKRFGYLRRQCTKEQSVAKADLAAKGSKSDSSVIASTVSDAQNKMQRSILKQLESSEGYVAENIKYSKSEDLFDDSSLLSREQRALRVSNVSNLKIGITFCCNEAVCSKNKSTTKPRAHNCLRFTICFVSSIISE